MASKIGGVPKTFSRRTLGEFEDASASIPLRQLDRAFESANIRLSKDSGGNGGMRRTQFRRYVAAVDQHDPQQLRRLGAALGALVDEAAPSKRDFLVKAAERDGFFFEGGVFEPAGTAAGSFAVTRVEDLASIDDRGKRLQLLANDSPKDAVAGAKELLESVCRTVLRLTGERPPRKNAGLVDVAKSALDALEFVSSRAGGAENDALVRRCLEQLGAVVAGFGELRNSNGSGGRGNRSSLAPRHARLAIGAAVTFAGFVAETYLERAAIAPS